MHRKRTVILVSLICGLVVLFLIWLMTPPKTEPEYNGKYYTEWLEQFVEYAPDPSRQSAAQEEPQRALNVNEARDAIKQIGTNAVPTLIGLIENANFKPQHPVTSLLYRSGLLRTDWNNPAVVRDMVNLGFSALRSEPGSAVPPLIELLNHEDSIVRELAINALATIGPQAHAAVPALIGKLEKKENQDPRFVIASIRALREIRADAENVVPVLLLFVSEETHGGKYGQAALSAIGRYGDKAAFAATKLREIGNATENKALKAEIFKTVQRISIAPVLQQGSITAGTQGWDFDDALLSSARQVLPEEIIRSEIEEALQAGLWNSNRTAVAISIPRPGSKKSLLFVFLQQNNGSYLSVDVSGMEGANVGFIGPDRNYDRVETKPLKWLSRKDGLFQIQMQTHAWHAGQRYTGTGNRVIKPDGTYISQ